MIWSVVLAAGSGNRFGRLIPKQYELLAGRRVLDWSLDAARVVSDGVVLVVPPGHRADPETGADRRVAGGATRSDSVRAGLGEVPDRAEIVVVHDAARPLAGAELFRSVIRAVRNGADGAVPAIPVVDTLKRVDDGTVVSTVDRSSLVAVQTPQAFSGAVLRRAHATGGDATDDAALVEAAGGRVVVVDGAAHNLKITVPADLQIAELHAASLPALADPAISPPGRDEGTAP